MWRWVDHFLHYSMHRVLVPSTSTHHVMLTLSLYPFISSTLFIHMHTSQKKIQNDCPPRLGGFQGHDVRFLNNQHDPDLLPN